MNDATGGSRRAGASSIGVVVIHGVGEADTGWINDSIVAPLEMSCPDLRPAEHSEYVTLPDRGAIRDGTTFSAIIRRASLGSRADIAFAELNWSDISRIRRSAVDRLMTTSRLFFEAPEILARAFTADCRSGLLLPLSWLICRSSGILKHVIAALYTILFACLFVLILLYKAQPALVWLGDKMTPVTGPVSDMTGLRIAAEWNILPLNETGLRWVLAASLAAVGLSAFVLFVRRAREGSGLTAFSLCVALWSALGIGFLATPLSQAWLASNAPQPEVGAFMAMGDLIFFGWAAWCVTTTAAVILMVVLWISLPFSRDPHRRVLLGRAAAAHWHILLQAIAIKLIAAPLVLWSANRQPLRAGLEGGLVQCDYPSAVTLTCYTRLTSGVFAVALAEAFVIALTLTVVSLIRLTLTARRTRRLERVAARVPRLIVSPLLIGAALLSVSAHIAILYFQFLAPRIGFLNLHYGYEFALGNAVVGMGTAFPFIMSGWLLLLRSFYNSADGLLHVARDIVDHQFQPQSHMLGAMLRGKEAQPATYPRRRRIEQRLDALLEYMTSRQAFDRLVLMTHSQGTVIMYDYLKSPEHHGALDRVAETHVLTLGCPLSHLYQRYFAEYSEPAAMDELQGRVRSWRNFYRIDDPIGNHVDVLTDGAILNTPLRPGGHVDYWKEPEVQAAIHALLTGLSTTAPGRERTPVDSRA